MSKNIRFISISTRKTIYFPIFTRDISIFKCKNIIYKRHFCFKNIKMIYHLSDVRYLIGYLT